MLNVHQIAVAERYLSLFGIKLSKGSYESFHMVCVLVILVAFLSISNIC